MRRLRFSTTAERDLDSILRFITIESGSLKTGMSFVGRLRQKCRTFAGLPGTLGRARDELETGLRSLPFKTYVIFFRYEGDDMNIVTILHGMRDIDAHFDSE